jgi:two-component system LytT family response regulator
MKFKTVIIDDEINSISAIEKLLERYCPQLEVIQTFTDSREGLKFVLSNSLDLLFLDIQMPFLNGVDLIKKIPDPNFEIIFCTAYDQYAIDAIKLSAIDYLLKPVDPENLIDAVNRFTTTVKSVSSSEKISELLSHIGGPTNKKLVIQLQDKTLFLDIKDILFLKAESNYTHFTMVDEKTYFTSKTIKYFQEKLKGTSFFRPHQSYLINTTYITEYSKTDNSIILKGGKMIPVSKNKKEEMMKRLME